MSLQPDGTWHNKYHFDDLEVGESMEVCGVEQNIRSAASAWGTRYGIWLKVERVDDGYCKVTRLSDPIYTRKKELTKHEQLCERLDAVAQLLRLVLDKLNGHDTNKQG